jgi:hypothetical protein
MKSSPSVDGIMGEIQSAGGALVNNDAKAGSDQNSFPRCLKATAKDKN